MEVSNKKEMSVTKEKWKFTSNNKCQSQKINRSLSQKRNTIHKNKWKEVNDKNEMEVSHRKRNVSHKKKKRNLVTKKKCQSKKINGS